MAKLLGLVPYVLAVVVMVGAIVDFSKDSDKYKSSKLKATALALLLLGSILTLMSLYQDNREKEDSRGEIKRLEAKADAANDAQRTNTRLFIDSFGALHQEVSNLQIQVKTDALQKKADALQRKLTSVQGDLEATEKALAPGPKAILAFSFMDAKAASQLQPITDTTIPVNTDGNVHVEFTLMNQTDVDALDVQVNLNICDQCKFAREPTGFTKLTSESDTERFRQFANIPGKSFLETLTADIVIPPPYAAFVMSLKYRCRTCVMPAGPSVATVRVARETLQMRKDVFQQKQP